MHYDFKPWGFSWPKPRLLPAAQDRFGGDMYAPKAKRYHAQESGVNNSTSGKRKATKRYADGRQKGKRK